MLRPGGEPLAARGRRTKRISAAVKLDGRALWTLSADGGRKVYGETIRRERGSVWRRWDPFRSKLGAGIIRSREDASLLLPKPGSTVVYLGAGHGTTISHLHDHLCGADNIEHGRLIAVDVSARCLRDLNQLAQSRPGIVPVLGDARKLAPWSHFVPTGADWLFQDVSQAGQVGIFSTASGQLLKSGGTAILSFKGASERWNKEGELALFAQVERDLESAGFAIHEAIELQGLEDQHVLYRCTLS